MAEVRPILTGHKTLIVGIANDQSIAYGCAQAFRAAGADLAITWLNDKARLYVEPLGTALGAQIMTMRGLSAAYWLLKTNPWMKAGDTILIHAAAGGVGLIAVQWAKLLGLRVIGTVSTLEKAATAKAHGCDEIIFYRREDVAERVRELTNGEGVTTVYDTVGKDTFDASLKSLKRRGVLVGCGTASGPFPPIDALKMAIQGSVYFTRPALADYIADPAERAELAGALFDHVASGRIKVEVNQRYALEDAVQAHRDLEARRTTGSSVFVVEA